MIQTQNPTTGHIEKTFTPLAPYEIARRVDLADQAYHHHRTLSLSHRADGLLRAADILEKNKNIYAALMTKEMGKPLAQGIAEAEKCAAVCRYYAKNGEKLLRPRIESNATVRYDPLGLILAVMPWNFPFWQVIRCAAPLLMSGNGMLVKHASNVPQCALAIQDLFEEAGFTPHLFQTLLITKDAVAALIGDHRIRGATLTGSEVAGASLASLAGTYLKPTVLELGGSDPLIILPSADIDLAATTAVKARMLNTGQSCIAAKRFLIHTDIYDAVVEKIMTQTQALIVGDPMDTTSDLGPLATLGMRETLVKDVDMTLDQGARPLLRGGAISGDGFFYSPTILADIPESSPAAQRELFGPVISLYRINTLDHAVHVANQTPYGLGASVWTHEKEEQDHLITHLEAGTIVVNGMVRSDPALPFGGVKASGYGRELGAEGLYAFTNIKTVKVNG